MTTLGFSRHRGRLVLSCRPDPARPVQDLARLCDLSDIADVLAGADWALASAFHCAERPAALDHHTAVGQQLATTVNRLLEAISVRVDCTVNLMGQPERIAVLAPAGSRPTWARAFCALTDSIDAEIVVVAHESAAVLGTLGSKSDDFVFLACDWRKDLTVVRARFAQGSSAIAHLGTSQRLRDVGPQAWPSQLLHRMHHRAAKRSGLAAKPLETLPLAGPSRGHQQTALQDALESWTPNRSEMTTSSDDAGETDPYSRDGRTLVDRSLRLGLNFLKGYARAAAREGCDHAIVTGDVFRTPAVVGAAQALLAEEGCTLLAPDEDQLLAGLRLAAGSKPLLPYDVGVLLRRPSDKVAFGTLLFTRPTAVGQTRKSEIFTFPLKKGETLEAGFYIRRFDWTERNVAYQVIDSHVFAPKTNKNGEARLQVRLRLDSDTEDEKTPVRLNCAIKDINDNNELNFNDLRLEGLETEFRLLRDPKQLICSDVAQHLSHVLAAGDPKTRQSVADWRKQLEGRAPGSKVSRANYAFWILGASYPQAMAEGGLSDIVSPKAEETFLSRSFMETASGDEFQEAARALLFESMVALAWESSADDRHHVLQWLTRYDDLEQVPTTPDCARELVNSISQDLANQTNGDAVARARGILGIYPTACAPWQSLNVDW